ncbi:helix-turn-helix transcriptional regulator [Sporosarcina limicola]|uniref:ArsR family transcriptional regulator n=1 Tax=Sporosarcina limicola TaxID=34101 RepID=A0A927MEM2_9BACL|nr:metalloregulator ArsR/SmtB family transcription factor [Sporosarcina limicola]MBE1553060.1 putative ArsR family transcriptional regulator [Sporosarcina limicola]
MDSRLTTKEKLLNLLKKETKMTVNQLAQALNVTEMAVRKHLNILERDSFIHIVEVKQPLGRPVQVFSLTPQADVLFPKSYDNLTVDFLSDLQAIQGNDIIHHLFEKRSKRLANKYSPYMKNKISNEEIVETLKNIQIDKGYMADVIKIDDNQFELIEHNCPIFEVAKNFKQACNCETNMFKEVLNTNNVRRTSCKADGEDHCHFLINFNGDSPSV